LNNSVIDNSAALSYLASKCDIFRLPIGILNVFLYQFDGDLIGNVDIDDVIRVLNSGKDVRVYKSLSDIDVNETVYGLLANNGSLLKGGSWPEMKSWMGLVLQLPVSSESVVFFSIPPTPIVHDSEWYVALYR